MTTTILNRGPSTSDKRPVLASDRGRFYLEAKEPFLFYRSGIGFSEYTVDTVVTDADKTAIRFFEFCCDPETVDDQGRPVDLRHYGRSQ